MRGEAAERQEGAELERGAYSIAAFCAAHEISKTTLYELWAEGRGPARMQLRGGRVLISREAAAEWRQRLTAEGPDGHGTAQAA